jgi:hypothetical protein
LTNGRPLPYKVSIKTIQKSEARVAAFSATGLFVCTVFAAVSAAVVLELFTVRRIDGGSLTTHFPGYVYANASVLKAALFETAALLISAIILRFKSAVQKGVQLPRFGSVSMLMPPADLFVSSAAVVTTQYFVSHASAEDSSFIARIGVLVLAGVVAAGAVIGALGLVRKERPFAITFIAFISNLTLLFLFYYFQFYKLGFDQDNWAN